MEGRYARFVRNGPVPCSAPAGPGVREAAPLAVSGDAAVTFGVTSRGRFVSENDPTGVSQRLALYIDRSDEEPVYRQIVDRLWHEIITGTLETGDRLPTVRQLAIDLNVRPDTVSHAYEELELLGVLITRPGQGTFVGLTSPDRSALERHAKLERLCSDVVSQSKALGLRLDEVIDALVDLRNSANDPHTTGGSA